MLAKRFNEIMQWKTVVKRMLKYFLAEAK